MLNTRMVFEMLCTLNIMQYEEFIASTCQTLNIPREILSFRFILDIDRFAQIPLNKDDDFKKLMRYIGRLALVYISRTPCTEVVKVETPPMIECVKKHVYAKECL